MKILVPLDGSALAEKAVHYVRLLKPLGDLRVRLISALDTYEGMEVGGNFEEWQEKQGRQTGILSSYLEGQAQKLRDEGFAVETEVCHGQAGPTVIADAERFEADLIIISTHGRSGFQRWRLGSVADKVIRGSGHNTLVLGPHFEDVEAKPAIKSLVVPLDGSPLAEQVLPLAELYAKSLDATLHLVRAVSYPVVADDVAGYAYTPELFDSIITGAKSYLAEKAAHTGVTRREAAVLVGPAAEQIEQYIRAKSIDLVMMTSHGRGGLARTALGSVTDRLIGSGAPVLVVRAEHPEGETA